jgi:hypothetical protein
MYPIFFWGLLIHLKPWMNYNVPHAIPLRNSALCHTVFLEGPRSRSYGRTAALRLIVQPYGEDEMKDDQLFLFFQVMEHQWNETDRGKPKYSRKNLSQCHFVHHKSHTE